MQIENVASGGTQKNRVSKDDSSRTSRQSQASAPRYKIEVRNFSPNPDKLVLEWYVFAKPVGSSGGASSKDTPLNRLYIHDKGSEVLGLEPRKSVTTFFQPKPIVLSTEMKTSVFNSKVPGASGANSNETTVTSTREQSGAKMAGWLVRLVADGHLVDVKASQPTLEQIGRDPKVLAAIESESPVKRGR